MSPNRHKRVFVLVPLLAAILFPLEEVFAQEAIAGTVSFITSQNVYLRFDNTNLLQLNDTIYKTGGEPCLILLQKSSVSCIAEPISDCELNKGDEVVYYYYPPEKKPDEERVDVLPVPADSDTTPVVALPKEEVSKSKSWVDDIDGRFSFSNSTNVGEGDINSRSLGRLSINARNIGGSKFSFYNYARFRYNSIDRNSEKFTDSQLSFYQLALEYEPDSSITISIGRKINNRMLSVGALDGLSAEKRFRKFFVGAMLGTRPDPLNYGFNSNFFQYGAYVGIYHGKYQQSNTSIGMIDQSNNGATDRRYLFAQHRSRISDKINLFASTELDIYQTNALGNSTSELKPTSFYMMVNYRITRKLTATASYDMRRNRILYETYSDNLENLLANDPSRNGYRLRLNYRLTNNVFTGAGINYRNQSDGRSEFTNINAFLSFMRIPYIGGRWSNVFATNGNSFFQYRSLSSRYTRQFLKGRLSLSPNVRYITYDYLNIDVDQIRQLYLAMDVYYDIGKNLSIGANYEYASRADVVYHRFNTSLIQRF